MLNRGITKPDKGIITEKSWQINSMDDIMDEMTEAQYL